MYATPANEPMVPVIEPVTNCDDVTARAALPFVPHRQSKR